MSSTRRYALQLSPTLQQALLPHVEALDPAVAAHLRTVYRSYYGDIEVPVTGEHLKVIARAAAQHPEIPSATRLFNLISIELS
jgi:hypothetical protein